MVSLVPSIARMIRSSVSGRGRDSLASSAPSAVRCRLVAVTMTRSPGSPAGNGLGEHQTVVAPLGGRCRELDPGPRHLRAMEVHPSAAADDRRTFLGVESIDRRQPDQCRPSRPRSGWSGVADLQGRRANRRRLGATMAWASQSNPDSLASSPAWILISPTSSRVSRSGSNRKVPATWIDRIVELAHDVVNHDVPGRTWTRSPGLGTRPRSQVAVSDHRPSRTERTSGVRRIGGGADEGDRRTSARTANDRSGSFLSSVLHSPSPAGRGLVFPKVGVVAGVARRA